MTTPYDEFARRLRANSPTALVVVIEGPHVGATMLVTPNAPQIGSLGNDDLDRVAARDALGELEAGRTGVRHYGPQGQT
ncbi:MAG: XdhC family protein, partial [Actinomycetota bacterium]